MDTLEQITQQFHKLQSSNGKSPLTSIEQSAYDKFKLLGVPTSRHEEWKYTRISPLFNKEYSFDVESSAPTVDVGDVDNFRSPGSEAANQLVFVNGRYDDKMSHILSGALDLQTLEEAAANENRNIVLNHFGHSSNYINDGIHALNTAFLQNAMFIGIKDGVVLDHPIYIYNIIDARSNNVFAQPRLLVHVGRNAQVRFTETYHTIGVCESFINQVTEVVVEQDAWVEYYKIQNDVAHANQVNTTHIRQVGKSVVNTVTISLNGGIVRNNLNIAMEAEHCESHFYGLYFLRGNTLVDNHTIVDNVKPNCVSNELYKGIIDDWATGIFNGKIFVQKDAQKTNAFQSNKNVLLSDDASVNTKPQLEIYADDVKCSHGCTVGKLNEEGLFYLRSRGIPEKVAKSLLVRAFAIDILDYIKAPATRQYVDQLISQRLEVETV